MSTADLCLGVCLPAFVLFYWVCALLLSSSSNGLQCLICAVLTLDFSIAGLTFPLPCSCSTLWTILKYSSSPPYCFRLWIYTSQQAQTWSFDSVSTILLHASFFFFTTTVLMPPPWQSCVCQKLNNYINCCCHYYYSWYYKLQLKVKRQRNGYFGSRTEL